MKFSYVLNKSVSKIDINSKKIVKNIYKQFLMGSKIVYIIRKQYFIGVIIYEDLKNNNFDVYSSIKKDYPFIIADGITEKKELEKIFYNNEEITNIPVFNSKTGLVYEYVSNSISSNALAINKERWSALYNDNNKVIDFIMYKNYKEIKIIGKLKYTLKNYIEANSKIKCIICDNKIDTIIEIINEKNMLLIDTDNMPIELLKYIVNIELYKNSQNLDKIFKYVNINDLCDEAELYYFAKLIKDNNIKTHFFLCQTPEQLTNLNYNEQLRIKFDKHYRYYFDNTEKDEAINEILKKVLGELYSPKFIESRNQMSGTVLKNGVCYLASSNNQYCKVLKGLRYTVGHDYETKYKINIFGPCLIYCPLQDDEHTIPSMIQKLVNQDNKDYWIYNYGQRAISMYENIRTALSIDIHEEDVLIFAVSPKERKKLIEYGITNIIAIADMLNEEKDFHDYFMGEPVHCNYIANQKISNFMYKYFDKDLLNRTAKPRENKLINEAKKISIFKGNKELKKYLHYLKKTYPNNKGTIGAIMVNCNPFTKGHYNLVKYASERVDKLYIFVVQEDKSIFKFVDRLEMVRKGTEKFKNVEVVGSGTVFGTYITFPAYFHRDNNPNVEIDVSMDIELFTEYIAPILNITKRFVGEEPVDNVTRNYNNQIKKELPKYNIEFIEIPRFEDSTGEIISAKYVRQALEENDWEKVKTLVPSTTLNILEKYRNKA